MMTHVSVKNPAVIIVGYILIVIAMFGIGAYYYVNSLKVRVATETARSFDSSMVTIQDFYSNEIVPRAKAAGVELAHDYHHRPDVIPFPATFTMDVGTRFERSVKGLNASLYSDTPFPWRQDRVLDDFETMSIEVLRANPDEPFIRVEDHEGRPTVRYASAVTLKESCVACHNQPEYRFGKVWQVGDFRGVRQVSVPLSDSVHLDRNFYLMSGGFMLIAALIGGAIVFPLVVRQEAARSEMAAMAAALDARNKELVRQGKAKDEFLANMSHELRTPLNAILGFTDMMQEAVFGPLGHDKYREYVGDIQAGGQHLRSMIDDLLDLARIERGDMPLTETEIDLGHLVHEVESLTAGNVAEAGMTLDIDVPADLPALMADERAVRQMLVNLVNNSAQHSGGTTIGLCAEEQDGCIVIKVVDDGRGLEDGDMSRYKERFYRGETSSKAAKGGLGIGLALVDTFATLHGGTFDIWQRDQGAAFSVSFPASRTGLRAN
ncbi:MAG: DUF3365 domain-containing protein [Rhodospirillales bacterium]|nr:DUF3365 domain-containing protein [Rhodospirillales bacterium]MBO6785255.1 DUF3365 domain-containing protein [Rhodospirillales bacterium]